MEGLDVDGFNQLDTVNAGDLAAEDIVGAYEDAYTSAATGIRAVGCVISNGRQVRSLNVAISSMEDNVKTMIEVHNKAKKLFDAEAHCCLGRPRSEVISIGGHFADWTAALASIGFSVVGLQEQDNANTTVSTGRSIATLCLGTFQLFQGWLADQKLQQVAYEQDLLELLKTSPGRVKYVKSMIAIFKSWETYQKVTRIGNGTPSARTQVNQIITTIEQLPVRSNGEKGYCRRDMFDALIQTETGQALFNGSYELQMYRRLVEAEYDRGKSSLIEEVRTGSEEEVVDFSGFSQHGARGCQTARLLLKEKKAEKSPIKRFRHHKGEGRRETTELALRAMGQDSPADRATKRRPSKSSIPPLTDQDLEEFITDSCGCYVSWNISELRDKIEGKYRIAQNQTTAVGAALKRHGASDVDFQASIAAMEELLGPITLLERVANHILDTGKAIPLTGLRARQQYRTAIKIGLTLLSFGTSTAETIVEFTEEEPNNTLKVVSFVALLLSQTGTVIEARIQHNVFNKMRDKKQLRGILSRKYAKTITSVKKYWERCQRAIETGHDSDVEMVFQTRVPKPVKAALSITDIAAEILEKKKKSPPSQRMMLDAPRSRSAYQSCEVIGSSPMNVRAEAYSLDGSFADSPRTASYRHATTMESASAEDPANRELRELETAIRSIEDELGRMQDHMMQLRRRHQELAAERQVKESEVMTCRSQVEEFESELAALTARREELDSQLGTTIGEKENHLRMIAKINTEIEQILQQIEAIKGSHQESAAVGKLGKEPESGIEDVLAGRREKLESQLRNFVEDKEVHLAKIADTTIMIERIQRRIGEVRESLQNSIFALKCKEEVAEEVAELQRRFEKEFDRELEDSAAREEDLLNIRGEMSSRRDEYLSRSRGAYHVPSPDCSLEREVEELADRRRAISEEIIRISEEENGRNIQLVTAVGEEKEALEREAASGAAQKNDLELELIRIEQELDARGLALEQKRQEADHDLLAHADLPSPSGYRDRGPAMRESMRTVEFIEDPHRIEEFERAQAAEFDERIKQMAEAASDRESKRRSVGTLPGDTELHEELDLMWSEVETEDEEPTFEWTARLRQLDKAQDRQRGSSIRRPTSTYIERADPTRRSSPGDDVSISIPRGGVTVDGERSYMASEV